MRMLAGIAAASLLSACVYVAPTTPSSASGRSGFVVGSVDWQPVSAEAGNAGLQALAKSFPDSSSVHLRMLQQHAGSFNSVGVVKEALWLSERGYSFTETSRKLILRQAGETVIASRLSEMFERNGRSIERSSLASTIPASAQLPESVVIDPANGRMLASTVISRMVFGIDDDGTWTGGPIPNANSLSGLAIDPKARVLWVASSDLGMTPQGSDSLAKGLFKIEIDEETSPRKLTFLPGGNPSDIHLAADGSLYASNPIGGEIYVTNAEQTRIAPLAGIGQSMFRSPQGLVTSEDGSKLYVSDYRYGIAIVDLATKKVTRLTSRSAMALDGIDGLWRYGNRLIGVQNGFSPMRIVSIELSDDGLSATRLDVLEQAHSGWTEPLGGTIHEGALYYVATGQWDRFDDGGTPKQDMQTIPTEARRLPL